METFSSAKGTLLAVDASLVSQNNGSISGESSIGSTKTILGLVLDGNPVLNHFNPRGDAGSAVAGRAEVIEFMLAANLRHSRG